MRASRGMTMAELLVSMGILLVVSTLATTVLVRGYQMQSQRMNEAWVFRHAAIGMDEMSRELRLCEQVYLPNEPTLKNGYYPLAGSNDPLVFRRFDANRNGETVVGFTQDPVKSQLLRLVYAAGFDPKKKSTWVVQQQIALADSTQLLRFTLSTVATSQSFLQLEMAGVTKISVYPMKSKVQVRGK